jgi:hypothetical protein
MSEIEELFEQRLYQFDEDTIIKLNESEFRTELNNVIVKRHKQVYSLSIVKDLEDSQDIEFNLSYITNTNNVLEGKVLKLFLSDTSKRDKLTFLFAKYLSQEYKNLDFIDVFNTFQEKISSVFERYGYFIINPWHFKEYLENDPMVFVKGKKGIIPVIMFNKLDYYKHYFHDIKRPEPDGNKNYVYLMFNVDTNSTKIGFSKNPYNRERTLQSKDPNVFLLAAWKAPKSVEKQLHKKFDRKRIRGEWFSLSIDDLISIKQIMQQDTKLIL